MRLRVVLIVDLDEVARDHDRNSVVALHIAALAVVEAVARELGKLAIEKWCVVVDFPVFEHRANVVLANVRRIDTIADELEPHLIAFKVPRKRYREIDGHPRNDGFDSNNLLLADLRDRRLIHSTG